MRGYLHWSAFDNFEWAEGYRPKFGLIAVNRDADFARIPKPSAYALARIATTGRLAALAEPPDVSAVVPPAALGVGAALRR